MTHFVELCAGSAALSMEIEGIRPVVSYAGSKRGYAQEILQIMQIDKANVTKITVVDPGLWGVIHRAFVHHTCSEIAVEIEKLETEDPKTLFARLISSSILSGEKKLTMCAAEALCKIAGTYGGKEIGGFKGRHKHRPSVDGYIPSRKSLVDRCKDIAYTKNWNVCHSSALDVPAINDCERTVAYIDPPYTASSGQYIHQLSRNEVMKIGRLWAKQGADVYISENEPLHELIDEGWRSRLLQNRIGQIRKDSRVTLEWVTYKTNK